MWRRRRRRRTYNENVCKIANVHLHIPQSVVFRNHLSHSQVQIMLVRSCKLAVQKGGPDCKQTWLNKLGKEAILLGHTSAKLLEMESDRVETFPLLRIARRRGMLSELVQDHREKWNDGLSIRQPLWGNAIILDDGLEMIILQIITLYKAQQKDVTVMNASKTVFWK